MADVEYVLTSGDMIPVWNIFQSSIVTRALSKERESLIRTAAESAENGAVHCILSFKRGCAKFTDVHFSSWKTEMPFSIGSVPQVPTMLSRRTKLSWFMRAPDH